jgi:hypothetical protein
MRRKGLIFRGYQKKTGSLVEEAGAYFKSLVTLSGAYSPNPKRMNLLMVMVSPSSFP